MTIEEAERAARTPASSTRRWGTVTVVSGALGVACAAGVLLTPPMVPVTRFSYPFDTTWFVVSQLVFAVQHLAMVGGVLGLAALPPPRSRLWRPALVLAGVAFGLLIGCELLGVLAAGADEDTTVAGAVAAAYGLPTVLLGVAFVLAGWLVGRRRLLPWGRWIPFVFGLWVFVVLIPALAGPGVAGRLALGGWMLLYLLLGVALVRRERVSTVDRPDAALVTACRMAAVVSGVSVLALLLFYALELRAPGPHVFGPVSDVTTVVWDLLLVVVVVGLRPALGTGRAARAVVAATVATASAGAVASALLVVAALPFEIATPAAVVAILVQSLWLHLLSRGLRRGPWSPAVVRLGWWAPVAQAVGAVVVAASLALPWGTLPQVVVMVSGIAVGLPAWAAWPVWFGLASREIRRHGMAVTPTSHPSLTQEPSHA